MSLPDTDLPAALFNSAITAFAIVAAWESGLLDELNRAGVVDLEAHARRHDQHLPSLRAMNDVLACAEIVDVAPDGSEVKPLPAFRAIYETKGFFVWLLGGCGELLRTAGAMAANPRRTGAFLHRDARMIGHGTGDFGARFIDPVFDAVVGKASFSCIADLGCGSGERLIRALTARPGLRGIGVDISAAAVALTRERLAAAGLADRALVIQGDARELDPLPEFMGVDFLTCFLMGHDFWPRENCIRSLKRLREAFPAAESFVLCDTYRSEIVPSADVPLLTLGFEYVHAIMGQYIPSLGEWREVFPGAGWRCAAESDVELPPFTKVFHLVRAEASGGEAL